MNLGQESGEEAKEEERGKGGKLEGGLLGGSQQRGQEDEAGARADTDGGGRLPTGMGGRAEEVGVGSDIGLETSILSLT